MFKHNSEQRISLCVTSSVCMSSETVIRYLYAGRFAGVLLSHGYILAWASC